MAEKFVPFLKRTSEVEASPEFQFSQYQPSVIKLKPTMTAPPIDRGSLRARLVGDLRNAVALGLAPEVVQQYLGDLAALDSFSHAGVGHSNAVHYDRLHTSLGGSHDKPNISLQKDGDKVTHVTIECRCGEVIPLDCIY